MERPCQDIAQRTLKQKSMEMCCRSRQPCALNGLSGDESSRKLIVSTPEAIRE